MANPVANVVQVVTANVVPSRSIVLFARPRSLGIITFAFAAITIHTSIVWHFSLFFI
jgi:hypothetical protein